MKKITTFVFLILCAACIVSAQYGSFGGSKIILKSGDLKQIKSEKKIKVEYDYSNIKVGAYNSESEYIDKKVKEYNAKEKGKGDKWQAGWVGARKDRYEPKFKELYNKCGQKIGMSIDENASSSKYTLIVKTTFIEPGFNVGVAKQPAYCNFEFLYVETANPSNVVCELYINNVIGSQGMGFDFDTGSRIQESYAKAGKMLMAYILKSK